MVKGEKINVGELCTLSSTCLRLSVRLGLERIEPPRPGLHDPGGYFDLRDRARAVSIHDVEPQSLDEADTLQSDDAHDGDDAA